jgi:hypothetical protein
MKDIEMSTALCFQFSKTRFVGCHLTLKGADDPPLTFRAKALVLIDLLAITRDAIIDVPAS